MTSLPDAELRRVARHLSLPGFGLEQQERLHDAHVLIVGAGGLGCPILQQLAAGGVGEVTLVDDDTVDLTNIHRQILFGAQDVGKPKVDVAAERAQALQPGITVNALRTRLDTANAVELIADVDLVLDGSDSFATKYLVADACEITGTPLVWGTVLRFHGDVAVWHSGQGLDGVGLRDVFPHQLPADAVPDCATAGVLGVTTSVIGGLMSTAAIAWLTGLDRTVGRITSYDAIPAQMRSVQAVADPARRLATALAGSYDGAPAPQEDNATVLTAVTDGEATLLDIREPHEVLLADFPAELRPRRLPLSTVSDAADVAEALSDVPTTHVVVACASGKRSANFVRDYAAALPGLRLESLVGGLNALNSH